MYTWTLAHVGIRLTDTMTPFLRRLPCFEQNINLIHCLPCGGSTVHVLVTAWKIPMTAFKLYLGVSGLQIFHRICSIAFLTVTRFNLPLLFKVKSHKHGKNTTFPYTVFLVFSSDFKKKKVQFFGQAYYIPFQLVRACIALFVYFLGFFSDVSNPETQRHTFHAPSPCGEFSLWRFGLFMGFLLRSVLVVNEWNRVE